MQGDRIVTGDVETTVSEQQQFVFNPFEPGFIEDPHPTYKQLRDVAPVHETTFDVWILSRYEDVSAFLRSEHSAESQNATGGRMRERFDELDGGIFRGSMLDRDPPEHTRLRKLVAKAFTLRSIAALEPMITGLVAERLDQLAEAGTADLVEVLAFPLPFEVISRMLGMPPTDVVRVRELSGIVARAMDLAADPKLLDVLIAASKELKGVIREMIAWKRENPGDDLLTALIDAEEDGDRLTVDELIAQIQLLFIAGHETTVNMIGGSVLELARNPDQLALLQQRPELIDNALDEFLRYVSPVQQSRRFTISPYRVGETVIPTGKLVVPIISSANRDERFWGPDAAELRLDRANARQHLSFGGGPHYCIGASLARLEARVAIGNLVQRFDGLTLAGDVVWNGRFNLRGPLHVPVSVH
jgi:cytochrome P450